MFSTKIALGFNAFNSKIEKKTEPTWRRFDVLIDGHTGQLSKKLINLENMFLLCRYDDFVNVKT